MIFGAYSLPRLMFVGGFMGLVVGGAFAVILSITERRHRLEDLSLWRTALWGALGGFLVAAGFDLLGGSGGLIWSFVGTMTFAGAVSSAGTVAVARRAEPKLLEGDEEPVLVMAGDDDPALGSGGY